MKFPGLFAVDTTETERAIRDYARRIAGWRSDNTFDIEFIGSKQAYDVGRNLYSHGQK